jgi:hypothetical protein
MSRMLCHVALGEKEAQSILSFCTGGAEGRAAIENHRCVIHLRGEGRGWRFEAPTFEEALTSAADAGRLRRACIDKQIAFWSRNAERPQDAITRVLMSELGAVRGRIVEREIAARVGRSLSDLTPDELTNVASAAEIVLGMRVSAPEAMRIANRVLEASGGAQFGPAASPGVVFELAKRIARLLHETQKERGETAVRLGCDGERFASELAVQRAETDRSIADLESFAGEVTAWPPVVQAAIASLKGVRRSVMSLRAQADTREASPHVLIDGYTDLNATLLAVIDAIVADAPERLRVLGVAFTSLTWAKENTGRERAQLAVAFGRDRFAPGQIFTVGSLFGAQESCLRLFTTAAPRDMVSNLNERLSEPPIGEVRRLEALALSHLDGGFGVDPAHWYEAMTRKVDLIGEVADAMAALIARRAAD